MELIYKEEVYAIVGAAMDVYNHLGPGFPEAIYQEAMELEVADRKIPSLSQQEIRIPYKGRLLKSFYKPDLICFEKIVVEIKALNELTSREDSQVINYLKATGFPVGVLINFGSENKLEWKRLALTTSRKAIYYQTSNSSKIIRED